MADAKADRFLALMAEASRLTCALGGRRYTSTYLKGRKLFRARAYLQPPLRGEAFEHADAAEAMALLVADLRAKAARRRDDLAGLLGEGGGP